MAGKILSAFHKFRKGYIVSNFLWESFPNSPSNTRWYDFSISSTHSPIHSPNILFVCRKSFRTIFKTDQWKILTFRDAVFTWQSYIKKKQKIITHGLIADLGTQNAVLHFNALLRSQGTIPLKNFYFLQQKPWKRFEKWNK